MFYGQLTQFKSKHHRDPLWDQEGMLSLRGCLINARRMLVFVVEQVFLPTWMVWWIQNVDARCTAEGRPKGRENFVCLNFSCFAIKYELYFTVHKLVIKCPCWNINTYDPVSQSHNHKPKNAICLVLDLLSLYISWNMYGSSCTVMVDY